MNNAGIKKKPGIGKARPRDSGRSLISVHLYLGLQTDHAIDSIVRFEDSDIKVTKAVLDKGPSCENVRHNRVMEVTLNICKMYYMFSAS